jgi:hypothetical protein
MKHRLLGGFLTLVLAVASAAAVCAQAVTFKEEFTEPYLIDAVNPCTGEPVRLSGELHVTSHMATDVNGGFHRTFGMVPQDIVGEGASGATYRAVGGLREAAHLVTAAITFTQTQTFNLISQGPGDNFTILTTTHFTLNPDGDTTVVTLIDRAACRG